MNLEQFYAADSRRQPSGEVDFGVMWAGFSGGSWPRYRVSWVKATGEVYAVRQSYTQDDVQVLGVVTDRPALEAALEDWPEHCVSDGIGWVRSRLSAAGFGPVMEKGPDASDLGWRMEAQALAGDTLRLLEVGLPVTLVLAKVGNVLAVIRDARDVNELFEARRSLAAYAPMAIESEVDPDAIPF